MHLKHPGWRWFPPRLADRRSGHADFPARPRLAFACVFSPQGFNRFGFSPCLSEELPVLGRTVRFLNYRSNLFFLWIGCDVQFAISN